APMLSTVSPDPTPSRRGKPELFFPSASEVHLANAGIAPDHSYVCGGGPAIAKEHPKASFPLPEYACSGKSRYKEPACASAKPSIVSGRRFLRWQSWMLTDHHCTQRQDPAVASPSLRTGPHRIRRKS